MAIFIRFVFGAVIGSFLNVLSLRYDPDKFILDTKLMGGRSHCPHCKKTLRWHELIPLLSFAVQGGKCRACRTRLTFQYPLVELLSALIFVFIPLHVPSGDNYYYISSIWIFVFTVLLLISIIDIKHYLLPDEGNIALVLLGLTLLRFEWQMPVTSLSFLDGYASIFGFYQNLFLNRFFAVCVAAIFFWLLIFITKGRGMGWGDLKLVVPLALLFGWPDILFLVCFAFVAGSVVGIALIIKGKKTMKQVLPFGPFLALGAVFMFFMGAQVFSWYFGLIGL